ncbi:recombination endonuclease VII [Klebsiella phage MY02]
MDEIKEIPPESFGSIASTGYFDGQYLPDRLKRIEREFDAEYNYYDANVIKATIEHIKWLEAQLRFSDRPF